MTQIHYASYRLSYRSKIIPKLRPFDFAQDRLEAATLNVTLVVTKDRVIVFYAKFAGDCHDGGGG